MKLLSCDHGWELGRLWRWQKLKCSQPSTDPGHQCFKWTSALPDNDYCFVLGAAPALCCRHALTLLERGAVLFGAEKQPDSCLVFQTTKDIG